VGVFWFWVVVGVLGLFFVGGFGVVCVWGVGLGLGGVVLLGVGVVVCLSGWWWLLGFGLGGGGVRLPGRPGRSPLTPGPQDGKTSEDRRERNLSATASLRVPVKLPMKKGEET